MKLLPWAILSLMFFSLAGVNAEAAYCESSGKFEAICDLPIVPEPVVSFREDASALPFKDHKPTREEVLQMIQGSDAVARTGSDTD